jgi:hypothetical protein
MKTRKAHVDVKKPCNDQAIARAWSLRQGDGAMSLRKAERNQAIASAVTAGEPLKIVAARYGVSVARVSKIVRTTTPSHAAVTIEDIRPTLIAMQTMLDKLLKE